MYTHIAQEEDNKMTEGYQKDADTTLIFVSPHCQLQCGCRYQLENTGRVILCHSRYIPYDDIPRPETGLARNVGVLPWKHL
jgi:hypothetical protein